MKNLLLLFLIFVTLTAYPQLSDNGSKPVDPKLNRTAGDHLVLSGQYQYAAIFTSAAAMGIYMLGINDAEKQHPTDVEAQNEFLKQYRAIAIGAGVLGVVFNFASIHHKIQAGKKLNQDITLSAYAAPSGVGVVFRF